MEPLFLIIAAGEGKRLYPETKDKPKAYLNIGKKKLVDLVVGQLPKSMQKAVLLRQDNKFGQLEQHLRKEYGFSDETVLYQDRITASPYLSRKIALSELPLAYYLASLPPSLSKNSRFIRQFNPIVLVPADIIVEGLDYKEMIDFHVKKDADLTMPVKEDFVAGSNTRVYTVGDGRLIAGSGYVHPPLSRELEENERIYTHEGTYVIGRRFFDSGFFKLLISYLVEPELRGLFRQFRAFPYEGNFNWIDVRDMTNLKAARERYGKK